MLLIFHLRALGLANEKIVLGPNLRALIKDWKQTNRENDTIFEAEKRSPFNRLTDDF